MKKKRKLKNPLKVNFNKLLRWIDKEIMFVRKMESINRKKLHNKFET